MRIGTVKDVALLLKVSPKTIYQWAELGRIPCLKLNGAVRFDLDKVMGWVELCQKGPDAGYNALAQTARCPKREVMK